MKSTVRTTFIIGGSVATAVLVTALSKKHRPALRRQLNERDERHLMPRPDIKEVVDFGKGVLLIDAGESRLVSYRGLKGEVPPEIEGQVTEVRLDDIPVKIEVDDNFVAQGGARLSRLLRLIVRPGKVNSSKVDEAKVDRQIIYSVVGQNLEAVTKYYNSLTAGLIGRSKIPLNQLRVVLHHASATDPTIWSPPKIRDIETVQPDDEDQYPDA